MVLFWLFQRVDLRSLNTRSVSIDWRVDWRPPVPPASALADWHWLRQSPVASAGGLGEARQCVVHLKYMTEGYFCNTISFLSNLVPKIPSLVSVT